MSRIEHVPLWIRRLMFGGDYAKFVKLQRQGRVRVGRGTYGVPLIETFAFDSTRLIIGSYTSIARMVTFILGGNHPTDRATTYPMRAMRKLPGVGADGYPSSKGDICVGSDVWIGHGALILSGVTIGDGAIIGAGSVVVSDVPAYGIAAGNPARVIRYRVSEEVRTSLSRIAWWEWSQEKIDAAVEDLCGPDVAKFVASVVAGRWRDADC